MSRDLLSIENVSRFPAREPNNNYRLVQLKFINYYFWGDEDKILTKAMLKVKFTINCKVFASILTDTQHTSNGRPASQFIKD